jgi:hypothetical protein
MMTRTGKPRIWRHKAVAPTITRVWADLPTKDDCLWVLLRGDAHHDNPHSDHDLQRKHLDEALERDAVILDVGDLFCAMAGKADPRMVKHGVTRPEHAMASDYFDSLVRHNADFLLPYASNLVVIGEGNHETAVRKKNETCLTTRLVERINTKAGTSVVAGGYGGWLHFTLNTHGRICTVALKYFHGSGGGGLMSFDTLRVRRQASFIPGADVVVCGHVHERWSLEIAQEVLHTNGAFRIERKVQHHVRVGTYKDEYGEGKGGWHIERGGPPKPDGGYWMRLSVERHRRNRVESSRPRIELIPA